MCDFRFCLIVVVVVQNKLERTVHIKVNYRALLAEHHDCHQFPFNSFLKHEKSHNHDNCHHDKVEPAR